MSRRRGTPKGGGRAKKHAGRSRPIPTEAQILEALRAAEPQGLRPKEVGRHFGVKGTPYRELRDRMRDMERGGRLLKLRGGRLAAPTKNRKALTGRLSLIRSGAGFVSIHGVKEDVYVSADDLSDAMHGDEVEVSVEPARGGRRASGRVRRVVERSREGLVGVVRGSMGRKPRPGARRPVVEIGGRGPTRTLMIESGNQADETELPSDGDVVVIRVTQRGARNERMAGQIVEVLGSDDDPKTDSLQVIRQFGLSETFPERVNQEVSKFAEELTNPVDPGSDPETRVDQTGLHVLTIDPADARDHDDALSVEPLEDGGHRVGVHIADVSYYVRPGTAVDAEAQRRGTSTYLVDRAVPMLPELLSSDICSLKAGRDRRALSLFFRIKPNGAIGSSQLQRTWVRPKEVLSYESAQEILKGTQPGSPETVASLHTLRDLAEILRIRRVKRGALDFDLPEAHVVLNPDGSPQGIRRRLRLEVHRIIEEWMLAANEAMAKRCREVGLPVLFRVHDAPDQERLETLSALAATHGHTVPRQWTAKALQQLLDDTRGEPEEGIIHNSVLRVMRRATYDAEPSAHFGLAVMPYLHFTSPIRRYPDLHLHQMLDGSLLPAQDESNPRSVRPDPEAAAAELAIHTTDRERQADEAGRESVALARMRFMEGHVGEEFSGVVSRVFAFGFFVTLDEEFVDGLVHVRSLDDHYTLDESTGVLVGARRGLTFQVGDSVTIRVARVDRMERQIDFELVGAPGTTAQPFHADRRGKSRRSSGRNARRADR